MGRAWPCRYASAMTTDGAYEIFLVATPGLEGPLCAEARALGYKKAKTIGGGVSLKGSWSDIWRINLEMRGAGRVLARIETFPVTHLAQLDRRARRVRWETILRPDKPFRVEASCTGSRIYHSGAAGERIERAIREELGAPHAADAEVCVKVRIAHDVCTIAVDTSGEPLHRRGHKQAVAKAPLRETMAALFLRQCGYVGTETVVDPMCGSGTFVIEAAEIAAGLKPGRSRRFAFEDLATFDRSAWERLRAVAQVSGVPDIRFYGRDGDPGAIRMSEANAARAGVSAMTEFEAGAIEDLVAPPGPPGLVVVNPPYGDRVGDASGLMALYRTLGQRLIGGFAGWRVGLVTSRPPLAAATGLPFTLTAEPVSHGGLFVTLFRTGPL